MAKFEEWLTKEGLNKIKDWAKIGLSDEQLSHNMGIATSTLYEWKKKYSEISEALREGKGVVDGQVENALLKRALGYEYDEITIENGKEVKRVRKHVVPDTSAQMFWLRNRKPDVWREKHHIEHSGYVDLIKQLDQLSDEELDKMLEEKN